MSQRLVHPSKGVSTVKGQWISSLTQHEAASEIQECHTTGPRLPSWSVWMDAKGGPKEKHSSFWLCRRHHVWWDEHPGKTKQLWNRKLNYLIQIASTYYILFFRRNLSLGQSRLIQSLLDSQAVSQAGYACMDGSVHNRTFIKSHFVGDPALHNYVTTNIVEPSRNMAFIMDPPVRLILSCQVEITFRSNFKLY